MRVKHVISFATAALLVWMTTPCQAALTLFLHMDGIPGDSLVTGHSQDTAVTDFQFGAESGSPNPFLSLSLDKNVNVASPTLAFNCATGMTNTSATLSCYRSGGTGSLILTYSITVSNVVVTSVSTSASSAGTVPSENLNLRFSYIQWTFVPQNPDGSAGTPIVTSYTNH